MPWEARLVREYSERLDLVPFSFLQLFETDSLASADWFHIGAKQQRALHRSGDGTTNEAVEPVVVGLFGSGFPFVNSPTAALGFDEVLCSNLFGEHAMRFGLVSVNGQATTIAHCDRESRVSERLPPVRVVNDVSDCTFPVDAGDSPVQTNAVAGAAFVFAEWIRGRTDESTMRRQ